VSGDNIQARAYAEYICKKYNIDAFYNGVTRNPRLAQFNGMSERDIDPTEDNKHLAEMEHMGFMVYHPFRFTDKSEIVKMYSELGLTDLFEITRSCEGEIVGIDYKNYIPGQYVPVCNECFWCKEREWAISCQDL
jgi:7-cyano-7-deazaguanine synthase in queuosine biosynthesis